MKICGFRFWGSFVAVGGLVLFIAVALSAQTDETKIILPPPPVSFLDEFPDSYRAIPPFEPTSSFTDPENAVIASRQVGYTELAPSSYATNYDTPLLPPTSLAPPATKISAQHPPGYPPLAADAAGITAAKQFILDRAIREDYAFPTGKPNLCFECFADVFPNGTTWLRHGNKEIPTVIALIEAVDTQCVNPELNAAKNYWHRHRPIASGDTRIKYLDEAAIHLASVADSQWMGDTPRPFDLYKDMHSFPSGHSTTGMIYALVLADMAPANYRPLLLARGIAFGDDRVLLGAHYPSDVEAGRVLAEKIYESFADDSTYRRVVLQARIELKAVLDKQPSAP